MTLLASQRGWYTVMDLDFTSLGTISLATNGTYNLGGYTWTKLNSAQDSVAAGIDSTGLAFTPTNSPNTNYSSSPSLRNLPLLTIPLTSAVPNFNLSTGIRVWVYNSVLTATQNYQISMVGVDNGTPSYNRHVKRGYSGTNIVYSAVANNSVEFVQATTAVATNSSSNVLMFELPQFNINLMNAYFGSYSSGFPQLSSMTMLKPPLPTAWDPTAYTLANSVILLGGLVVSGAPTVMKFARIKVEAR